MANSRIISETPSHKPYRKNSRPVRVDGDLAYVTLSGGYVAIIDADDAPLVEGFSWSAKKDAYGKIYACRKYDRSGHKKLIYMHRVVSGIEGLEPDHKNGDGLDNRKANLRAATPSQNRANVTRRLDNTSGYKGVSWHKRSKKWQARIRMDGREKFLGYFGTAEDARDAYQTAAIATFGEFARF